MQRRAEPRELLPLFDAIVASPSDDAPRQVLADALVERGDARGEFIALQLLAAKGLAQPEQQEREQTLFKTWWQRWFDEIPGLGVTPTSTEQGLLLRRGFPESATLSPRGQGADSPAWRTLQRLDVVAHSQSPAASELGSPYLESLEVLTGLDAAALGVVLAGPGRPRLRELGFAGPHMLGDRARREQAQVLATTRFPALRLLSLSPSPFRHHADWLGWLFEAEVVRRLERVRLWMELPFDVSGLHGQLIRQGLTRLKLELVTMGVRLVLDARWLTVQFDSEFWLSRHAQAVRNLAAHFAPFPYREFDVRVGPRPASSDELQRLGDLFMHHAVKS